MCLSPHFAYSLCRLRLRSLLGILDRHFQSMVYFYLIRFLSLIKAQGLSLLDRHFQSMVYFYLIRFLSLIKAQRLSLLLGSFCLSQFTLKAMVYLQIKYSKNN